jgi:hypothetical protein
VMATEAVTLEVRPRRRWWRNGWQYRVATYGETHWGNGVVGWCRSRDRAVEVGRRYQAEIASEVVERRGVRSEWRTP